MPRPLRPTLDSALAVERALLVSVDLSARRTPARLPARRAGWQADSLQTSNWDALEEILPPQEILRAQSPNLRSQNEGPRSDRSRRDSPDPRGDGSGLRSDASDALHGHREDGPRHRADLTRTGSDWRTTSPNLPRTSPDSRSAGPDARSAGLDLRRASQALRGQRFDLRGTRHAERDPEAEGREESPVESVEAAEAAENWAQQADDPFLAGVEELRELVVSAGAEVVAELVQRRARADAATLIGSGKLEEVRAVADANRADVVLFGQNLTPTQLRNLEQALDCRVIDRTQLILDIFARHARTREGMLQVELAQLEYMLPRLTGRGRSLSRQGGGIGTRGPGETQLETDRRRIQRRISVLKGEIEAVRRIRGQQRQRREAVPVPTVALVGYTNAGKSTLFNALTGAQVLASSRMFATLDPKLRAIVLPSRRKVLLSDTVGFIRDLPPTLISSFRATLEEVEKAEVLLHVEDCSGPMRDEHRAEVRRVLTELGAGEKPRIEVLNKIDRLSPEEQAGLRSGVSVAAEGQENRRPVAISAQQGWGLEDLLLRIDAALASDPMVEVELRIPQSEGEVLAALEAGGAIHHRAFEGNLVYLRASAPASLLGRFRRFVARDLSGETIGPR